MRLALALLLGLSACAARPVPGPAPAALPSSAALGEWAGAGPYAIRPVAVVEDSRCPLDVQCVWAGRLVVKADVARDGHQETRLFALAPTAAAPGLALIAVTPERTSGSAIPAGDYRFRFAAN